MAEIISIRGQFRDLPIEIAQECARIRQVTTEAADALKLPRPNTFLGRKTHEPFP